MVKFYFKKCKKGLVFVIVFFLLFGIFFISNSTADDDEDSPDLIIDSVICQSILYEDEETEIIITIYIMNGIFIFESFLIIYVCNMLICIIITHYK